jgi:uncharacterized protein YjbI with pentapeptide repeats
MSGKSFGFYAAECKELHLDGCRIEFGQFENATIRGSLNCEKTTFSKGVNFESSQLEGAVSFKEAQFEGDANFDSMQTLEEIRFDSAKFDGSVTFKQSKSAGRISFQRVHFIGSAAFDESVFLSTVDFSYATFGGVCSFSNVEFNDVVFRNLIARDHFLIEGTKFSRLPDFVNANLDRPTAFDTAVLPNDGRDASAAMAVRWRALARLASFSHNHELAKQCNRIADQALIEVPKGSRSVFISYRRASSSGIAGRVYDKLSNALASHSVFMDVVSLPPGVNFFEHIRDHILKSEVVIVVIGQNWIGPSNDGPRIRADGDFVRMEVALAIAEGKMLIPLFVEGGVMPRPEDLPDDVKPLTLCQGLEARHERFHADLDILVELLNAAGKP